MHKLPITEIIALIADQQTFEATASDGSFRLKINRYVPYCCAAIHDGSQIRPELQEKIKLTDYERWYEEDPHTAHFVESMPITITGLDSRFEYDLNRPPETAIYEEAWGKTVWKKKLSTRERQVSQQKHANFYTVVDALIQKLEEQFGGCVVFDMHSYNHQRWDRPVPLFNLGTENVDLTRFGKFTAHWLKELAAISLTGIDNRTAENDVFHGRGYFLRHIVSRFKKALVLATEVKKVFCDELTGEDYPAVIRELQLGIKHAVLNSALLYCKHNTNWKPKSAAHLLGKGVAPGLTRIDTSLFRLLRTFEVLAYVNPTNISAQQKKFVQSKFTEPPRFKYPAIKFTPFELKRQLNQLPLQDITDISVRNMYESVINCYLDKIDLLASLGTKKFLYNSLRYFGRPSKSDLRNATFILHLPSIPSEPEKAPIIALEQAVESFKEALTRYGIDCKIEFSKRVVSQVMVLNSKRTIVFRPDAQLTQREVKALIAHEIGVHMLTTQNSARQKLKIFNLGLPVNTETQEGLAILAEYLSGNLTLRRLRALALRVVLVDMMCSGAEFNDCFNYLINQHNMPTAAAFTMVTRVFRGGGFTKDYLYLSGFVKTLAMWNSGTSLEPLLVGKTSLGSYQLIVEMMERELVQEPTFITHCFNQPSLDGMSEIHRYILSGLT